MSLDPMSPACASRGVAFAPADREGRTPPRRSIRSSSLRWPLKRPAARAAMPAATSSATAATAAGSFRSTTAGTPSPSLPARWTPARTPTTPPACLPGLLKRYGGNVHEALSAYNAGSPKATGTTTRWADGQTLGYADSVMRHYEQLGGTDSPHSSAIAECATTIASVGALQSQAQRLPMPPLPSPGALAHPTPSFVSPPSHRLSRPPQRHRREKLVEQEPCLVFHTLDSRRHHCRQAVRASKRQISGAPEHQSGRVSSARGAAPRQGARTPPSPRRSRSMATRRRRPRTR